MSDLTPVITILTGYNHRLARDLSPVHRWIAEGCDLHLDVIPVITEWTAKKPNIYSLGFFTRYVQLARNARLAVPLPIDDRTKADRIAFITRVMGQCRPAMTRWLEAYEEVNGAVTCCNE